MRLTHIDINFDVTCEGLEYFLLVCYESAISSVLEIFQEGGGQRMCGGECRRVYGMVWKGRHAGG